MSPRSVAARLDASRVSHRAYCKILTDLGSYSHDLHENVRGMVGVLEMEMTKVKRELQDLNQKIESTSQDMGMVNIKIDGRMKEIAANHQEQFTQFYMRCFFGVSVTLDNLLWFLTEFRSRASRWWSPAYGSCRRLRPIVLKPRADDGAFIRIV